MTKSVYYMKIKTYRHLMIKIQFEHPRHDALCMRPQEKSQ